MTEPPFVAKTLDWCNARRKVDGMAPLKRLPRGVRSTTRSCPVAIATGHEVWAQWWWVDKGTKIPVPTFVTNFIVAFDGGQLPQYEAKS